MIQILIVVCGVLLCIGGALGMEQRKVKITIDRPVGGSGSILLNLVVLVFGLAATVYGLAFLPR